MKRFSQESDDSSDSSSAYFEIRHNGKHMPPLPLFTRKLDKDDDISGTEAMLKRRKKLKKTKTTTLVSSSSVDLKMNWTKNDELTILTGIVKYENEKKWSYASEWNDFYDYMRDSMDSDFSKKQLINKIKKLKKKFKDNQARSNHGKGLSFTNTDDEEVFNLSLTIWGEKEIESASNESFDQTKWLAMTEDVPCEEDKQVSNTRMKIDNGEKEKIVDDLSVLKEDEDERVISSARMEIDNGEKEKSEEDLSILQEALVVAASFQKLGENLQKSLLGNLKNIGAKERKELTDEWKALLAEDMQLNIKKQTFSAKLVNAGFSA